MSIKVKRIYEGLSADDGIRILVDRLWPRGLSKKEVQLDKWLKDIAPSDQLRHWFNHEPEKWNEFKQKYFSELKQHPAEIRELKDLATNNNVTLLYAAKNENNNAVALREYVLLQEPY